MVGERLKVRVRSWLLVIAGCRYLMGGGAERQMVKRVVSGLASRE